MSTILYNKDDLSIGQFASQDGLAIQITKHQKNNDDTHDYIYVQLSLAEVKDTIRVLNRFIFQEEYFKKRIKNDK